MMSARLSIMLTGLYAAMRYGAWRHPAYRAQLAERDLVGQIRTRDAGMGRWYEIKGGKIRSRAGIHPKPDVTLTYETAEIAVRLLMPPIDWLQQIEAAKGFQLRAEGPDELVYRFTQAMLALRRLGWESGTDLGGGERRYTSNTNGGPCFVYVKHGKILRITPIDFVEEDAPSWTITARGRKFTPQRKTTVAAHTLAWKSMVYSPDRLLHPMRRVDFDPNGERNPQNRGKSDYVRISWEEALDTIAAEIRRAKMEHGPGAITFNHPSHHWGNTMRLGCAEPYGTVHDLLEHAEMVVFWSCDPESTSGLYAGYEGSL